MSQVLNLTSNPIVQKMLGRKVNQIAVDRKPQTPIMSPNDMFAQGDVGIIYMGIGKPLGWTESDKVFRKLVPGNTQGSRHIIKDVKGFVFFDPPARLFLGSSSAPFLGPRFFAPCQWELTHPEHDHVIFESGYYQVVFQQELGRQVLD